LIGAGKTTVRFALGHGCLLPVASTRRIGYIHCKCPVTPMRGERHREIQSKTEGLIPMKTTTTRPAILCSLLLSILVVFTPGLAATPEATSVDRSKRAFNPKEFNLTDLVKDLDKGNYFKLPPGAKDLLRKILASGEEFTFRTHNKKGVFAYISSDLSPNIWINLSNPPERLGESICHEILHYQDFKTAFKPITGLRHSGFKSGQQKVFYGQVRDLINMMSHEYVKKGLEKAGFNKPLVAAMERRMRTLTNQVEALEKAFVSLSKQLAARQGKKTRLTIGNLQMLYKGLMLNVLRDKLLFDGSYTKQLDLLMRRFQACLDFMLESTSEDPRFKKVYRKLAEPADAIRVACKKYHESSKNATERYALLTGTLGQMYKKVGISFGLIPRPSGAPVLFAASRLLPPGQSFLLDGAFTFSNVKQFTPHNDRTRVHPTPVSRRDAATVDGKLILLDIRLDGKSMVVAVWPEKVRARPDNLWPHLARQGQSGAIRVSP